MAKKTVITFGTFDLFHIGHLNLLERASKLGESLIVGVSTNELNYRKKQRMPFYNEADRVRIVSSLRFVDKVFMEESLERKREYIVEHKADILVMGSDWEGRLDDLRDVCEVTYLPRTEKVSTTQIIDLIHDLKENPRDA